MYFKFLVLGACLALAASASIPSDPSQVDLREAFETADAYYIPISEEEAEQLLRQPRNIAAFKIPSFGRSSDESATGFIPTDENTVESLIPNSNDNRRLQRSVDAFETEDAYYLPLDVDQTESSRAKRQVKVQDSTSIKRIDITPPSRPNFWENNKLNIQGGGSARQGIDIQADARAKLWESNNRRNRLDGNAQYSQHLGGPFGNSRPNFGGGLTFTHNFK